MSKNSLNKNISENTVKRWWNEASEYYQSIFKIPYDDIYYGPFCPTEKKLNLLDTDHIKGKRVLELGCGGGQCSVYLAHAGAVCSGIDISKNQISFARELALNEGLDISYHIGSSEDLKVFRSSSQDFVLSVFSLQYVEKIDRCTKEVYRVLKKGGKFIFALDHPFYSVLSPETLKLEKKYTYSGWDQTIKTSDIIPNNIWYKGDATKFAFYYRTISEFHKSLIKAGFIVEKIIEEYEDDASNPWNSIYSKQLAHYVAPTIIFVAKK